MDLCFVHPTYLLYNPSWREDNEISNSDTRTCTLTGENSEDGWIQVIEGDRIDDTVIFKVVFVRDVVSMPCNNIEWCVVLLRGEQLALEYEVLRIVELLVEMHTSHHRPPSPNTEPRHFP